MCELRGELLQQQEDAGEGLAVAGLGAVVVEELLLVGAGCAGGDAERPDGEGGDCDEEHYPAEGGRRGGGALLAMAALGDTMSGEEDGHERVKEPGPCPCTVAQLRRAEPVDTEKGREETQGSLGEE